MPNNETLQNLNVLLGAMKQDHLGREDFTASFKNVVAFIKRLEAKNKREIQAVKIALEAFNNKLKNDTTNDLGNLKAEVNKLVNEKLSNFDNVSLSKIKEIDTKLSSVKNGKDADEERILENLKAQVHLPTIEELKDDLPKMGEQIRDALELLNGENRLDASAIKGLEDRLMALEERPLGGKGGGGFSYIAMDRHIIDPYTPTGLINGTNADFGLIKTPNPTASLIVWQDGQKMKLGATKDYTLSGKTITFVTAPLADTEIEVTHRI